MAHIVKINLLEAINYDYNIEIHPDTPSEGRSIHELFPAHMVQGMYENLNQMGTTLGLKFVAQDRLSNSYSAILLGEYIHLHHPEQESRYHDAVLSLPGNNAITSSHNLD